MAEGEVQTRSVTYPSNGGAAMGFLAEPATGSGPGVVVIQEWWGVDAHIRDLAGRFARAGFVALAPDLYHGAVATEPDEARKLAMEMDQGRALHEIVAAARYLKSLEHVAPKKVGVVGWCMGGGLAYFAGWNSDEFAAVVGFYGRPPSEEQVARFHAPVLGLFAEHDHGITADAVQAFETALARQGKVHATKIYPGANHAFFNDTRPHIYHAAHAQDAWQRTLAWFGQYLR